MAMTLAPFSQWSSRDIPVRNTFVDFGIASFQEHLDTYVRDECPQPPSLTRAQSAPASGTVELPSSVMVHVPPCPGVALNGCDDGDDESCIGEEQPSSFCRVNTHDALEPFEDRQGVLARTSTHDPFEAASPRLLGRTGPAPALGQYGGEVGQKPKLRLSQMAFSSFESSSSGGSIAAGGGAQQAPASTDTSTAPSAAMPGVGFSVVPSGLIVYTIVPVPPIVVQITACPPRSPTPVQVMTIGEPTRRLGGETTVMLRHLPLQFNRTMLLHLMDSRGFTGLYDFVYMPIDFQHHTALGYAFVDLTCHEVAVHFRETFGGFSEWCVPSKKRCTTNWSDKDQGFEANVERYRSSPLLHDSVPDEYRPALFKDGCRIPFPCPTKRIKPPRQGATRMLV